MFSLIWLILCVSIFKDTLTNVKADAISPKIAVIGAGASGISAAAKLIENGYNDIVILEAENRIGGRVNSVPFGKGFIDLGAQTCEGREGNVVYELVHEHFEFGEISFSHGMTYFYSSNGQMMDQNKCSQLTDVSEKIMSDNDNMGKFNKSFGEFFQVQYEDALKTKEFEDIDKQLADQILDLSEKEINSIYATETWFDLSTQILSTDDIVAYEQMTWKEHGYKTVFDFITKKRPDPTKAINVEDKISFNKEVTNLDWNSNKVIIKCADGSEYQADHVIVTASLGVLKKHYSTLFTPQLPEKKINAIENTGFGTLGKIFLEFEEPFWPTDIVDWIGYLFGWQKDDLDSINGTDKEWLKDVIGFFKIDGQPNTINSFIAGKHMKQFEELSDGQLIEDSMWLLEKFLGKSLPRPIKMQRSQWLTNKNFLGSYSYPSMDTQLHNVVPGKDLAESLYSNDKKPVVVFAGEATDEKNFGYVHGAVASGWRAAAEILDYYTTNEQ